MPAPSPQPGPCLKLPPLILHPFAEPSGPAKLIEGSRANLALQGLLPNQELTTEQLERRLLEGRYCELSMLFYVGKDLLRWAEQSLEVVLRRESLREAGYRSESFLSLLIEDPPAKVDQKLRAWGVQEYKRIFSRAVGLHAVFSQLPPLELLSEDFLRNYHRYADHLYACRQQLAPFTPARAAQFDFELYASGEYARLLERQWEEDR
jgi:hypothetical protein